MWETVEETDRPRMTVWRMRIACCLAKATDTHSEYVILFAFPLQQWLLHDCACMLHFTRAVPKLMPTILLCWLTTSEANIVDMAVEVEPSRQYSVKFCCRATDDSRGAV